MSNAVDRLKIALRQTIERAEKCKRDTQAKYEQRRLDEARDQETLIRSYDATIAENQELLEALDALEDVALYTKWREKRNEEKI